MLGESITTVMLQVQDQSVPLSSEVVGMVTFLVMLISVYLRKFVLRRMGMMFDARKLHLLTKQLAPVDSTFRTSCRFSPTH